MAKKKPKTNTPDADKVYGGIPYDPPCSDSPEVVQRKVDELRRHLQGIYSAANVGYTDEEGCNPEALPAMAIALHRTVLQGTNYEYLAEDMRFAPYYRSVETTIDMLRCNMGVKMHWWPPTQGE